MRPGNHQGVSGSLGSSRESSGSFGVVGVRTGCHGVHSALNSFGCTLGVIGFIRGRWVHSGVPWGSSGSFRIVRFIRVHPAVFRVYSGRYVHSGAPWGSSGSFGVVRFIRVRPGGLRFQSGSLGSFRCTRVVIGFIWGCRVHSRSLGTFGCALPVIGFIEYIRGVCIHPGAPWVSSVSLGVAGFIRVRPRGHRVRLGSLGTFRCAVGVVMFIRGRWAHSCTP